MKQLFVRVRRNLQLAADAKRVYGSVTAGQLAELACMLKGKNLKDKEAAEIFSSAAQLPLMSAEFAAFCRLLAENGCLTEYPKQKINVEGRRISYFPNVYSEKAVNSFAKLTNAKPEPESGFNSACESVYLGRSTFCLLPVYNTNDGLMTSLFRLLQKYELKAAASTAVVMADGTTETEYLLLSADPGALTYNDRVILSITPEDNRTSVMLLNILCEASLQPLTVNTLPLEYTNDRHESIMNLKLSDFPAQALRCFLFNAFPDVNLIGIYSEVR